MHEHLASGGHARIHLAHCLAEQIFVGHAPDVLVRDVLLGDGGAVDHRITIAREEIAHVVEIAVATVQVQGVVARIGEHAAQGLEALVVVAHGHRMAGRGRDRQGDRFQSAHGAQAGRIQFGEHQAFMREPVEIGRQAFAAAEGFDVIGTQAFHRHQHHIHRLGRRGRFDAALDRLRVVDKFRLGLRFLKFVAQDLARLLDGNGLVEGLEVEIVGAEGAHEVVIPVAREFARRGGRQQIAHAIADEKEREHRQDQQGRQHGVPARPPPGRTTGRAPQRPRHQGEQHQGANADRGQDPADRIRLLNVADHLTRIDEVIDRDEIEARSEFVPEQTFGRGGEQHAEHAADHERAQHQAMQPAPEAPIGEKSEHQGERHQHIRGGGKVVDQPRAEYAQQPQRRVIGRIVLEHHQSDADQKVHADEQRGNPQQGSVTRWRACAAQCGVRAKKRR